MLCLRGQARVLIEELVRREDVAVECLQAKNALMRKPYHYHTPCSRARGASSKTSVSKRARAL